jgi:hypothetical protein
VQGGMAGNEVNEFILLRPLHRSCSACPALLALGLPPRGGAADAAALRWAAEPWFHHRLYRQARG